MFKKILYFVVVVTHYCYPLQVEHISSTQLRDSVTHTIYGSSEFSLVAHVISVPLLRANMYLTLAQGQREEVSSIAKRTGAIVAVNGCNYRRGGRYNGNRLNLLYLHKKFYADCQLLRGSYAWNNKKKLACIAPMALKAMLILEGKVLPLAGVNQPRALGQSVLYTDVADTQLLRHTQGVCLVIDDALTVKEVTSLAPDKIPSGWYVYQTDTQALFAEAKGKQVHLDFVLQTTVERFFDEYDFVVGGAGLLLQDKQVVTNGLYEEFSQGSAVVHCHDEVAADFSTKKMQEWLIELRHPRTAIGITEENQLCLVVIDGRQAASEGLTLHELGLFMKQLGCVDALNLGGGGCTTLCIGGVVVNNPSAHEERPVSEALCLYEEEK